MPCQRPSLPLNANGAATLVPTRSFWLGVVVSSAATAQMRSSTRAVTVLHRGPPQTEISVAGSSVMTPSTTRRDGCRHVLGARSPSR